MSEAIRFKTILLRLLLLGNTFICIQFAHIYLLYTLFFIQYLRDGTKTIYSHIFNPKHKKCKVPVNHTRVTKSGTCFVKIYLFDLTFVKGICFAVLMFLVEVHTWVCENNVEWISQIKGKFRPLHACLKTRYHFQGSRT